jgi:hypothetical protein
VDPPVKPQGHRLDLLSHKWSRLATVRRLFGAPAGILLADSFSGDGRAKNGSVIER